MPRKEQLWPRSRSEKSTSRILNYVTILKCRISIGKKMGLKIALNGNNSFLGPFLLWYFIVSWPQHHWHFGLDNSLVEFGGCLLCYGMFSNILGLYALDAHGTLQLQQSKMSLDIDKYPVRDWGGVAMVNSPQLGALIYCKNRMD